MPFEFVPTLAAFEDVLKTVIPILFMVLYVIGQLMGGKENAKKAKQPRPAQPPKGDGPPNQADALRREVEQFLRRAQGQEADPPQEKRAPAVATIAQRPAKRPTKQRAKLRQPSPREVQAAPQPVSRGMRKEGVAEHVTRHIDSSNLSEHAEQLGHSVAQADERIESRLQAKFGKRMDAFRHDSKPADQPEPTLGAQELFDLLSRPEGMRQAILMNEILRRPTDRW